MTKTDSAKEFEAAAQRIQDATRVSRVATISVALGGDVPCPTHLTEGVTCRQLWKEAPGLWCKRCRNDDALAALKALQSDLDAFGERCRCRT